MDVIFVAINTAIAFVSMVGSGFSWWQAHGSRKAKQSAQAQEHEARRQTEAAQELVDTLREQVEAAERAVTEAKRLSDATVEQVSEISRIADRLEGPELLLRQIGKNKFSLTNNSDKAIHIIAVLNREEIVHHRDLDDDLLLQPGQKHDFLVFEALNKWRPANLILKIEGVDEPVHLPFS